MFRPPADDSSHLVFMEALMVKVKFNMPPTVKGCQGLTDATGDFTTPPLPSSSPGPSSDSMDIIASSPLPHKPAFGSSFEIQLQSPTPELTPADSSDLSIPSPPLEILLEPAKLSLPQECVCRDLLMHITLLTWRIDGGSPVRSDLDLLGPKAILQAVCPKSLPLKVGCLPSSLVMECPSSALLRL